MKGRKYTLLNADLDGDIAEEELDKRGDEGRVGRRRRSEVDELSAGAAAEHADGCVRTQVGPVPKSALSNRTKEETVKLPVISISRERN